MNVNNILKTSIVFAVTYLVTCVVSAFGFWYYSVHSQYQGVQIKLEEYGNKHKNELESNVFGNIFTTAEKCDSELAGAAKEKSKEDIAILLGTVIVEEELSPKEYGQWPHDLFFVKENKNTFTRLDWNGNVTKIADTRNQVVSRSNLPFAYRILTNQCEIFSPSHPGLPDCQTSIKFNLGNEEAGYMVRRIPIDGNEDLTFVLISALLGPTFMLISLMRGELNILDLVSLNTLALAIPSLCASVVTALYWKRKKERKV